MKARVFYQFGNPLKVKFRKHKCYDCGNELIIKKDYKIINKNSAEAKYYDFTYGDGNIILTDCEFIHNVFYCHNCKKDIEFITQLSYEDNNKRDLKNTLELKKYISEKEMMKVWVSNKDERLLSPIPIDELKRVDYEFRYKGVLESVTFCTVERKRKWERPYFFKKNMEFKKVLSRLKKDKN